QVMHAVTQGLLRGRETATPARNLEQVRFLSVGGYERREDLVLALGHFPDDGGSGPIAKEHASGAVFPIHEAGELFRADEEDMLEGPVSPQGLGERRAKEKTRTGRGRVEGGGWGGPKLVLHETWGGGGGHGGGNGGYDDGVGVLGIQLGVGGGAFGRFHRH